MFLGSLSTDTHTHTHTYTHTHTHTHKHTLYIAGPSFLYRLDIIKEAVELPIENCAPFCLPNYDLKNKKEKIFLQDEVKRLLKLGYIKKLDYKPRYVSPIGCVPKKEGKFRLIHDLRHLNSHCESIKFKQEDIRTVEQIIQPNDFLTSVDLKDGFYHF